MFEFGILSVFVNFLQVISASEPTVLINLKTTDAEADKALVEIEPHQALPLVLFQKHESTITSQQMLDVLEIPKDLVYAAVMDRRMVTGTLFLNVPNDTQMFFCPKPNSEDKCLAPNEFNESYFLECAQEPVPVAKSDSNLTKNGCGSEQNGTPHNIVYEICPKELPYNYKTEEIPFYGFCYDTTTKNTVYTSHVIASPYLLKSNLLLRERRVEYSITIDDEFKPSNLREIKETEIPDWTSFVHPTKPAYKLQMLVPAADMALAVWRKTTYRNFNLDWQHEKLIPLWNQINDAVRLYATKLIEENTEIRVRTGITHVDSASEGDTLMSNIWIKIITTVPSDSAEKPSGVAILMNNFVRTVTRTGDSLKVSNVLNKTIEDLCEDDLICAKSLLEKFDEVGGRLRCCSLLKCNKKVRDVFGEIRDLHIDGGFNDLIIPGVTEEFAIEV